MRNVTLQVLLDDLRSESGHAISASMGQGTQDMMVNLLTRVQKRLWDDFAWPFLQVKKDITLQAGSRYYDVPGPVFDSNDNIVEAGITLERVQKASLKYGGIWGRLEYGISSDEYSIHDSDRGIRTWPVERYEAYGKSQIEVWPMPSNNSNTTTGEGLVRLEGTGNLSPFISLSDTADLDDQLIVLFAASELLTRQKSPDAKVKAGQANAHYQRLRARLSKTTSVVIGGGGGGDSYTARGPLPIPRP